MPGAKGEVHARSKIIGAAQHGGNIGKLAPRQYRLTHVVKDKFTAVVGQSPLPVVVLPAVRSLHGYFIAEAITDAY